jgi:hypothetical protein
VFNGPRQRGQSAAEVARIVSVRNAQPAPITLGKVIMEFTPFRLPGVGRDSILKSKPEERGRSAAVSARLT